MTSFNPTPYVTRKDLQNYINSDVKILGKIIQIAVEGPQSILVETSDGRVVVHFSSGFPMNLDDSCLVEGQVVSADHIQASSLQCLSTTTNLSLYEKFVALKRQVPAIYSQ
ncbi:hypothetical protein O9G_005359 [Rozella allomycis CSF55]|uniref:Replication factor A protein 3 n=1 Tax=Rozella allomycis (strain CSF55) TaxID=988480 RepID=A0A075AY26_ROZAC|nr:hypothetical protein O9G_005359 [Rozella allomycis CSF55]|eukprot:EPZ35044.1 hypothetical protein O9G_005359 [Rozella allomycis CSF55]